MSTRSEPRRLLRSCQCTQAQLMSPTFQDWAVRLAEIEGRLHRKIWEYCFIAQALYERGMLTEGRRGLGFAVGKEPLTSLFASLGCEILATDLGTEKARQSSWVNTGQHAASLTEVNERGLCPEEIFRQRVSFRFVDMRDLPDDLGSFDFIWSSCSFEHLGSLGEGERFVLEALRFLKPGGVAVHTTEYNVSSNVHTSAGGETVFYRKRDIKRIARRLRHAGYRIDLDFSDGDMPADRIIDRPPYTEKPHLKLKSLEHIITSYGLIIWRDGDELVHAANAPSTPLAPPCDMSDRREWQLIQDRPGHQDQATGQPVNAAAEMHKIRAGVRSRHGTRGGSVLSQGASSASEQAAKLRRLLQEARMYREVKELPFESSVPIVGALIAGFRNLWNSVAAKWHVRRLLQQQNSYNLLVFHMLQSLMEAIERVEGQQESLSIATLGYALGTSRADGASSASRLSPKGGSRSTQYRRRSRQQGQDWSYLGFSASFTADRDVVKDMYRQYVSMFSPGALVLDADCGQGPFVELLLEAGIEAYGVDIDEEMVKFCQNRGLPVEREDALEHLFSLPAESLNGVFCGHLVERLHENELLELLSLAHTRLRPGGVLVCETPNTRSPYVMSHTYFRDPTHQLPRHPETYRFLAESVGFHGVELRFSFPVPQDMVPEPLNLPDDADPALLGLADSANEALARINHQVFGMQNVALIARKSVYDRENSFVRP